MTEPVIAVSDTSPLNYLVQIGRIDLLPRLFSSVIVPKAVRDELLSPGSPTAVRTWMERRPEWVQVIKLQSSVDSDISELGAGEAEAITLTTEVNADVLLIDERMGRTTALARGLKLSGTLGVLRDAHRSGWIDGWATYVGLRTRTSFRCSPELEQSFRASLFGTH